jgi:hypothetical protein
MSELKAPGNLSKLESNLLRLLQEIEGKNDTEIRGKYAVKGEQIIKPSRTVESLSPEFLQRLNNNVPSRNLSLVTLPFYTVTVTNRTTEDIFTRIVVFYKRLNLSGVVFLEQLIVIPNESRVFNLAFCDQMESYVVGFFIDDDLVAKIPGQGNMTPQLASQLNSTDFYPCEDSWSIYS